MRVPVSTLCMAFGLSVLATTSTFADDDACRALADSRALSATLVGTLYGDAQSFDRTRASVAAVNRDLRLDEEASASASAMKRLVAGLSARANVL